MYSFSHSKIQNWSHPAGHHDIALISHTLQIFISKSASPLWLLYPFLHSPDRYDPVFLLIRREDLRTGLPKILLKCEEGVGEKKDTEDLTNKNK